MARLTIILGVLATVIYLLDGFRFMLNEWRNWRNKGKWLAVMGLCLMPSLAEAACGGVSPNLTAASVERTDVNDCVTASVTGDTITIPSGSSTNWSGAISLPAGKALYITGQGVGNTIINAASIDVFTVSSNSRIAHIEFNCAEIRTLQVNDWRIDHNKFTCATKGTGVEVGGSGLGPSSPRGLVDHNVFVNERVVAIPHARTNSEVLSTNHWTRGPEFGTQEGVYIEDNTHTQDTFGNAADCDYAGRYVARFNTMNDAYIEGHSVTVVSRACRGGEVYNNTMVDIPNANTSFWMIYLRGGTWMVFNNTITGTWGAGKFNFNNIRSCHPVGVAGRADGTSGWDQNEVGMQGYLARDQIGAGADATAWDAVDLTVGPVQGKSPTYAWLNTHNAVNLDPTVSASETCTDSIDLNSTHIVQDRDYYTNSTASGSPDTTGVRSGTRATMDAITTCTAGVGFWVTDEGEWNSTNGATPDGRLYVCGASNNWVLNYTPFTYPHPLNIPEGSTGTPANTPVVIARVLRWMEVAAFVTGMGWHFRKQVMAVSLAAIAGCGTLYQLAPRSYDTVKVVSKELAVKALTSLNERMK